MRPATTIAIITLLLVILATGLVVMIQLMRG